MTREELKKTVTALLTAAGVDNAVNEARWLTEELLPGTGPLTPVDAAGTAKVLTAARRRAAGEPLQYVLGTAPFRDLMLKVTPAVLIPRPETEELVEYVLSRLPRGGSFLDLGCGSGAIALSVSTERPDARVTAVDLSPEALAVARENGAALAPGRVEFLESDLFAALTGRRFHVIGANLPYVTEQEYPDLPAEVRDYEPQLALTAPENGLALIRQAITQLPEFLTPGGAAIFEMSPEQTQPVREFWSRQGGFTVHIRPDLTGRSRFVCGERLC